MMRSRLLGFVAVVSACSAFGSTDERPPIVPSDAGADSAVSDASNLDAGVDGATAPRGCNGAVDCERIVFITREAFSGALGGLEGADVRCQAAADASPLGSVRGRQYRAFMSDSTTPAVGRMPHGRRAYKRTDGHVVANDWDALIQGPLVEPIGLSEDALPPPTLNVWTGSTPDGFAGDWHCTGWRTPGGSDMGVVGTGGRSDRAWIGAANQLQNCTATAHLYCFEF